MKVTLRDITPENWRECTRLRVTEAQQGFVAPNVYSLAEAKVHPECVPLAIYTGESMVGFLMYALDRDDGNPWIYRLMIDEAHQGKGYAKAAMREVLARIRETFDPPEVRLSFVPENVAAERLYLSLGFRQTGEQIEGETVMSLRFDGSVTHRPAHASVDQIHPGAHRQSGSSPTRRGQSQGPERR